MIVSAEQQRQADKTERRAEELEAEFRKLAVLLFALELSQIRRALDAAGSPAEVLRVLRAAIVSYGATNGFFRQRWVNRFRELLEESALRQPVIRLPGIPVRPALPPAVFLAIETQAEKLATAVNAVSANRLVGVSDVVAAEIADRGAPVVIIRLVDPRREVLSSLIGEETAREVLDVIDSGRTRGMSIAKVARRLVDEVQSVKLSQVRATRIARTETISLVNSVQHERAVATGVLREKRWIHQNDERVRETHLRCGAEGWIPIRARYTNGLLHPGEPTAPPEETVNCRCSQAFRA